jgi:error-prone DNA polymerase
VELPLIIGSEVRIENGPKLVLLVENLRVTRRYAD